MSVAKFEDLPDDLEMLWATHEDVDRIFQAAAGPPGGQPRDMQAAIGALRYRTLLEAKIAKMEADLRKGGLEALSEDELRERLYRLGDTMPLPHLSILVDAWCRRKHVRFVPEE